MLKYNIQPFSIKVAGVFQGLHGRVAAAGAAVAAAAIDQV